MTDSRNYMNFRAHYYDKVGFRGVEEKKSLQILLNEDPVDIEKLITFCLRFPLPVMYRPHVWKLVLGIVPPHPESYEFVMQQRSQQYDDLRHTLKVTESIDEGTSMSMAFLKMFLLQEGRLPMDDSNLPQNKEQESFVTIATAVNDIFHEDVDAYWVTIRIYSYLCKVKGLVGNMIKQFQMLLQKQNSQLYEHLQSRGALDKLPYDSWFHDIFAGVLPTGALERIWDRLMGRACHVLVYVALIIVVTFRQRILSFGRADDIIQFLNKIPPDNAEVIVNEAIDLWEKNGSQTKPEVT
ncbi:TBC1 domain family member 7-like [Amphiura filiformis]|uniref:TBC1 domain family member 7-like n=1 Tax=Amphiura filiformis TaxID=82378 RepID=UPI003B21C825